MKQNKVASNLQQNYTDEEKAQARRNIGLAEVAHSGDYNDLINRPVPINGQVQSDWNQTNESMPDYIKNKPTIVDTNNVFIANYGSTTFSEASGAAGTAGKILVCQKGGRVAVLTAHDSSEFKFSSPIDADGEYYVFTLSNDDSWEEKVVECNRIHDLICQLKPIVLSGSTSMRFILCDRQKYTLNQGYCVFEPIDLYKLAEWINRGDVIQIDGAVAGDPWGDRYPMQILEMQCSPDSVTNKLYCTNIEVRGPAYSQTDHTYWGDNITDEATGIRYLEFQTWT